MAHNPPYPNLQPLPPEAKTVVDRYWMVCDPHYYNRLRQCCDALKEAAAAIDRASGHFISPIFDRLHFSDFSEMPWMQDQPVDKDVIRADMLKHASYYEKLAVALDAATSLSDTIKRGTSIPEQTYMDATRELITVYEENYGPVISADARQSHNGLSTQPSTHFIASCLVAIDPNCSLQMAVTCIEKARK